MIGKVYLSSKEYVNRLEDEKENYHCEKVKISDNYDL
jgi:hypothetical protein